MQEDANPTPCAKQTAMDSLKPLQNALRLCDLMGFNEATSSFRHPIWRFGLAIHLRKLQKTHRCGEDGFTVTL